jgi:lipopolysaccharide transport system permease protein/teichoic acid transport system permease protein
MNKNFKQELELVTYYANAKLKAESYRHFAGYFWWILDPLFGVTIYYFLFKVIMNRGESNYIAFLMLGLILWKWINECICRSSSSILAGLVLLKKIKLNSYIFPVVDIFKDTWKFLVVFCVLILSFGIFISGFSWNHLILIPLFIVSLIFIVGVGFLFSSLTPFLPDLQFLITYGMRLLFYASAVLFSEDRIPEKYQFLLTFNPVANIIKSFRIIIMKLETPSLFSLLYPLTLGVIFGAIGLIIIKNKNQEYAKLH